MDQSVAEDDADELGLPPKPFLHVASRVRGVKQSTIDARWSPLGASSIRAASTTLTLAYRPVMQRLSGTTQRRLHASSALALVYKRVTRKLTRGLPFPPATVVGTATRAAADDAGREAELDFESVLDGARALGRQLDPALHAVELLRREKERLERELELDYKNLQNLEAAASGQAREQRQLLKKAHVLAPGASVPRDQDVEMIFDEDDASVPPGSAFKVCVMLLDCPRTARSGARRTGRERRDLTLAFARTSMMTLMLWPCSSAITWTASRPTCNR